MRSIGLVAMLVALGAGALGACVRADSGNMPITHCQIAMNQQIAHLIEDRHDGPVDNVMACGTTIGPSRPLRGGRYGAHELIPLHIALPAGNRGAFVEIVTNDDLDGVVTAPPGAEVVAYGQYFRTTARQRPFVAGLHDVHCATHRGADNGWVVVNGTKYPQRGC